MAAGQKIGDAKPVGVHDAARALKRFKALKKDRNSWESHWQDICDFQSPRNVRLQNTKTNRGDSSAWQKILNSRGLRARRVLAAGMMAGMTSPARPWFRLATPDPELMEYASVKEWLDKVGAIMRYVFAKSNTYRVLHSMYGTLGDFGTAVSVFDEDYDNVIHLTPLLTGQYCIATDSRNRVSTLYREFSMTVEQLVDTFGLEKCSTAVQNAHSRGDLDTWIDVVHALEPRKQRDSAMLDWKNMAYASCYFEQNNTQSGYLSEGGMKRFRAIAARWDVSGTDAYGVGPGSEALGHIKQLQQETLRKAEAIDYQTKPPLALPSSMKAHDVRTQPGGKTYVDGARADAIKTLWDVKLDLNALMLDIQQVESAVDSSYYADMFLMLANDQRSGITAREVAERHEEKLLMLGPVLERLHNEMLEPLIDMTFERLQSARTPSGTPLLPPPPAELEGLDLQVEFVSTLAQAQRMVGVNSIDRYLGMIAAVAPLKPGILDKLDEDQLADVYADTLGTDATVTRSDDEVAKIREDNRKAQQAQQLAAMAKPMADAAKATKTTSEIPQEQQATLSDALSQLTGYSGA